MADLVTNYRTDRAIIRGRRSLGVEEWWLQDRRREVERILQRQINCVHSLRSHRPFFLVDRSSDPPHLVVVIEHTGALNVAECVVGFYFIACVVVPLLRVPNSDV